jgi:hypothetical protein
MAADTFCISPFFQHFLLQYNTPLLNRVRQHTTWQIHSRTHEQSAFFGLLTGRSLFNPRRLRRRLDDLHMGTARTGHSSMALWIFDFSLALAGFWLWLDYSTKNGRDGESTAVPFYAALGGKGSV